MTLPATLDLDGFRAAFRERDADPVDVAICVDFLQEQRATLADVLHLFAGKPPDWVSEPWAEQAGWWQVLALWCERTEPGTPAPPDPREHSGNVTLVPRYEMVRLCALDLPSLAHEVGFAGRPDRVIEAHESLPSTVCPAVGEKIALWRRDHKRQILELFRDVIREASCEISWREYLKPPVLSAALATFFLDNGFRLGLDNGGTGPAPIRRIDDRDRQRWVYTQAVPLSDWIPPESDDVLASFRRVVSNIWNSNPLGTACNVRLTALPGE